MDEGGYRGFTPPSLGPLLRRNGRACNPHSDPHRRAGSRAAPADTEACDGRFKLRDRSDKVLFSGIIEVLDRVGSHHVPFGGELCNPDAHLEGWLVGRGSRDIPYTLRALIVGDGSVALVTHPQQVVASISGMLIRC